VPAIRVWMSIGPHDAELDCMTPSTPARVRKCTVVGVLDTPGAVSAGAIRTRLIRSGVVRHRHEAGAHGVELPQGGADLVDEVGGVGPEPSASLGGIGPPRRHLGPGTGEERDVEEEGGHAGIADGPVGHGAGGQPLARGPAELGPDEVHEAAGLGRREHGVRFGRVAGQRLLAQDVLAGGQGLQGESGMGVGWGGDGDGGHPGRARAASNEVMA